MASLYEQFVDEFNDNKIELIVVDNKSEDESVHVIKDEIKKKHYTNVTFVENKENAGFSKGCNAGAQKARGKHILFLNNDTIVKDKGILDMMEYMELHNEVAILGGQLSNLDGSPQPSVGNFYTPIYVLLLLLGLQKYGVIDKNPAEITKVEWVKGGLLMIRKSVFDILHGFDEKIFMYTEDMEICYRANMQGYHVYFYPHIKVLHQDGGSSNRTFAIVSIYKNLLYFYKKHRSPGEYLFLKSLLRTKAVTLIGIGRLLRNSYYIQTYEKALKAT